MIYAIIAGVAWIALGIFVIFKIVGWELENDRTPLTKDHNED